MINKKPEDALKLITGSRELETIIAPFQNRAGSVTKRNIPKLIEFIKDAFENDLWDLFLLAKEYGDRAYKAEYQVDEDKVIIDNLYKTLDNYGK